MYWKIHKCVQPDRHDSHYMLHPIGGILDEPCIPDMMLLDSGCEKTSDPNPSFCDVDIVGHQMDSPSCPGRHPSFTRRHRVQL